MNKSEHQHQYDRWKPSMKITILVRVRDSFEGELTVQDFKEKFKVMDPRTYDTCEGDMGDGLDEWLENVLLSLAKKA